MKKKLKIRKVRGGREGGAEEWGSGKELKINVYIPISLIFSYEKLLRIRRITCVHAKISNCKYTTNFFNRITEYFQLSLFIGSVFFWYTWSSGKVFLWHDKDP